MTKHTCEVSGVTFQTKSLPECYDWRIYDFLDDDGKTIIKLIGCHPTQGIKIYGFNGLMLVEEEVKFESDCSQYKKFIEKKDKFVLDDNNNAIPANLMEWSEFLETAKERRRVGRDEIDGKLVSTVFLGLDHSFDNNLEIFETMVFKDKKELGYCERYATWKEAEAGHKRACQWVKDGCKEEAS